MRNTLLLLTAMILAGFSQVPAQDVCQEFSTWHQAHLSVENPVAAYRSELTSRGLSTAESNKRIAELFGSILKCPQFAALQFDELYDSEAAQVLVKPDAFLVECTKDLKPGRALDVAMGQGRNSIYLAKTGWEVTGFDISAKGLAVARATAEREGIKIQTVLQGWQDFDFGTEKWDLIVMSYAYVPIDDPAFLKRLLTGLHPGGFLVFEHHMADKPGGIPGGPTTNELLRLFGNELRILRYEDIETASMWSTQSKARVAHLLASK